MLLMMLNADTDADDECVCILKLCNDTTNQKHTKVDVLGC